MKKKISKSLLMTALITGLCFGGVQGVFAAENLQEFTLDPMIVTATRTEKNLLKVPASASVITAKEIQEKNVNTLREAFKGQPGIYIDPCDQAYGGFQMRGFNDANILVLYDGQPMNNEWNGQVNLDSIPVEQVERIEIVRGAASSLYGGRAVGGVINIISKDTAQKKFAGSAVLTYGSNNTWKKAVDVHGKINDKWSFGVGYEKRETDGYEGHRKTSSKKALKSATKPNGYEPTGSEEKITVPKLSSGKYLLGGRGERESTSENITANVKYDFDENKSIKYTYTHSVYDYRYNNPFSYVKDENGNTIFGHGTFLTQDGNYLDVYNSNYYGYIGERETDIHTLNYKDTENLWFINIGVQDVKKDGFSSLSSDSDAKDLNYTGSGERSSYPSKNYNVDIQKTWENIGKHTLTAGVNWKDAQMDKRDYNLSNWTDLDSISSVKSEKSGGKAENMSIFLQDEYKFDELFSMYLGGRIDHYKKYDGYNNRNGSLPETSYTEFSPKIAFEYSPDDTLSYYVSYGHSFNTPKLYNLYRETGAIAANPDLEPETSDSFEIGVKKKFDNTMLGIAAFHVKTDNVIYYDDSYVNNSKKIYVNADEGEKKGVEFDVKHEFNKNLNAYINYTWQKGEITTEGSTEDDIDIPRHLLHIGLDYTQGKFNAILDAQYVSERQAPDDVTGEYNSEDAFFVMNTYLNYKVTSDATLQFGVENIFDKEYYAGEATKGRTYYAGLRYSF